MGLGVPPRLNFVAEVMINRRVVLGSWVGGLVLRVSLFVGAVYRLYLFTSCNHGLLMSYRKSAARFKLGELVNGVIHIYPGFTLVLYLNLFVL